MDMVVKSIKQVNEDLFSEGVLPSGKLNPKSVVHSKWANRDALSFKGPSWDAFKAEIASSGGNIQPIKVRPVRQANGLPNSTSYEIVFGHRRHRACLELGFDVFALIEDVSDSDLFEQMDRENRQRANLTIYEQGEMYKRALDAGLYPSLRKMTEKLDVALGTASEAIALARLPDAVLDAFESRLDLQRRWAKPLTDALQKDPDVVLAFAKAIAQERKQGVKVTSEVAFNRLISSKQMAPVTRKVPLKKHGSMTVTLKGKKATFEFADLDASRVDAVEKAILSVLGG
jgi:ParB family chromosome partitioning protein